MPSSEAAATTGTQRLERPLEHWLLLAAMVMMWGSGPATNQIAVATLPPLLIVGMRLGIGAVVMLVMLYATGRRLPGGWQYWLFFAASALLGNAVPFFLITWAQTAVPSGLTVVFFAIMPLSTLLLAHVFIQGEQLSRQRLTGFLIGFGGILVLVGPDIFRELAGASSLLPYELAILAGAVSFAVNTIIARRRPACDAMTATTGVLVVATFITLPASLVLHPPSLLEPSVPSMLAVLSLGIFATALPTLAFFKLVSLAGASFTALINYLIPIWGLVLGITVMGEDPVLRAFPALVLILGGIMLAERRSAASRAALSQGDH